MHPVEKLLTFALAFGPFVLLALTVWLSRRRHAREIGTSGADGA